MIDQIKRSNPAAEYKLFKLFFPYIKSVCNRYSYSEEDAGEMVNGTFLKIFNYIDKYDPDYDFKPWIRKICINCCLTHNKKYMQEVKYLAIEEIDNSSDDESIKILENLDEIECMSILKGLSPQYRTVFNLYVFEDMKHHEIAEELNISVGTSKSNLSRAKEQLRELLKRKNFDFIKNKSALNG